MAVAYEVGKPFPGAVPMREGPFMEIGPGGGWYLIIQFPGLNKREKQAFKKSFKVYSYLESGTPAPIALWVFSYPKPFNAIDVNFNARIVPADRIESFLEPENGQVKNLLTVFLLDGQILKAIKGVGLDPDAVAMFHATIRKQLETEYSQAEYDRYLQAMFAYKSEELFQMGKKFHHKKKGR